MLLERQRDIINTEKIMGSGLTVIGAGGIGSMASLTLAKMGAVNLEIFDEDGVSEINLPNQFFRNQDAKENAFKVDALQEILAEFTDARVVPQIRYYVDQPLRETVIVATDSMASRRLVWEQFLKQPECRTLIEGRMGAELGMVYCIRKREGSGQVDKDEFEFYEEMLYSDDKVKPLPCTAKAIIYNVLMLASLICRAYKAVIMGEEFPREIVFNMTTITKLSLMVRK